jgi:hypothetical protein
MANLNFKDDLKLSETGEIKIKHFLEKKGLKYVSSNNDNKYDLIMSKNDKVISYEIKTDFKCAPLFDTGNLFVEFECRNHPSGISVTKSDWFVTYFIYLNEIWFIKSKNLKELISNNEFPVFIDAGDTNSETKGYLINRKKFKEYFYVCKV